MKLTAQPPGSNQKELDEVINFIIKQRVDDFQVPLELLAKYSALFER